MAIIKSAQTFVKGLEVVVNHHDGEHGGDHAVTVNTFDSLRSMTITQHMTLAEAGCLANAILSVIDIPPEQEK
jgi:hypothetical protein